MWEEGKTYQNFQSGTTSLWNVKNCFAQSNPSSLSLSPTHQNGSIHQQSRKSSKKQHQQQHNQTSDDSSVMTKIISTINSRHHQHHQHRAMTAANGVTRSSMHSPPPSPSKHHHQLHNSNDKWGRGRNGTLSRGGLRSHYRKSQTNGQVMNTSETGFIENGNNTAGGISETGSFAVESMTDSSSSHQISFPSPNKTDGRASPSQMNRNRPIRSPDVNGYYNNVNSNHIHSNGHTSNVGNIATGGPSSSLMSPIQQQRSFMNRFGRNGSTAVKRNLWNSNSNDPTNGVGGDSNNTTFGNGSSMQATTVPASTLKINSYTSPPTSPSSLNHNSHNENYHYHRQSSPQSPSTMLHSTSKKKKLFIVQPQTPEISKINNNSASTTPTSSKSENGYHTSNGSANNNNTVTYTRRAVTAAGQPRKVLLVKA